MANIIRSWRQAFDIFSTNGTSETRNRVNRSLEHNLEVGKGDVAVGLRIDELVERDSSVFLPSRVNLNVQGGTHLRFNSTRKQTWHR